MEVTHEDSYYRGKVSSVDSDTTTYTIAYDDGAVEKSVAEERVRASHWDVEIAGTLCVEDTTAKIRGQWNREYAFEYAMPYEGGNPRKRTTKRERVGGADLRGPDHGSIKVEISLSTARDVACLCGTYSGESARQALEGSQRADRKPPRGGRSHCV